ncbi:hypothetical protein Cflav_PD5717 [Pedosphaera parvula Ellin514]|uniref:Uncharacterized protein n=1 Tax=Pedosphaera parvula (strain Ellin514) TaxID=320771 RepID=B9XAP7_PEDPL|nr:hypothetical protein Cflav_PD5717 [Pedosphaera parvula Ellin514]
MKRGRQGYSFAPPPERGPRSHRADVRPCRAGSQGQYLRSVDVLFLRTKAKEPNLFSAEPLSGNVQELRELPRHIRLFHLSKRHASRWEFPPALEPDCLSECSLRADVAGHQPNPGGFTRIVTVFAFLVLMGVAERCLCWLSPGPGGCHHGLFQFQQGDDTAHSDQTAENRTEGRPLLFEDL